MSYPSRWSPPSKGFVMVNIDAALFEWQSILDMGVVMRDSRVNFLARFFKRSPILLDVQMDTCILFKLSI